MLKHFLFCATVLAMCGFSHAEESTDHMSGLRIPQFKNGQISFELYAKKGAHTDIKGEGTLEGITIIMYEQAATPLKERPMSENMDDVHPPAKLKITADFGEYDMKTQVATMRGHVEVLRFAAQIDSKTGKTSQIKDAHLKCPEARWDNRNEILSAPGEVILIRGDDILYGEDLTYYRAIPDQQRVESLRIERKVRMHMNAVSETAALDPKQATGKKPDDAKQLNVKISCAGSAFYDFSAGTITFSDKVIASQHGMQLQSTRLQITVAPSTVGPKKDASIMETENAVAESVAKIHAWESVTVTGPEVDGHGDQAVYDRVHGLLVLSGQDGRLPEMMYLGDRIRDEVVIYDFLNHALTATGESENHRGTAWLNATAETDAKKSSEAPASTASQDVAMNTKVTYGKRLHYDRIKGKAIFTGDVELVRPDMTLTSDRLEANIPTEEQQIQTAETGVRRVTAEGSVRIKTIDGREVTAGRASLDTRENMLRFTGRPVPCIIDPGRSQITAPEITITQIHQSATEVFSIVRAEGPGEAKFVENAVSKDESKEKKTSWWKKQPANQDEVIDMEHLTTRVLFEGNMDFDESQHMAKFRNKVVLTRGDLVVKSGELEVGLDETLTIRDHPGEGVPVQKITARKDVQLHASGWNANSDVLTYLLAKKTITLLGTLKTNAKIWEDRGSSISAPKIDFDQEQHSVITDGPGDLVLTETNELGHITRSARISWAGSCTYVGPPGKDAEASFRRNVVLDWQDMVIHGNQLQVLLGETRKSGAIASERTTTPSEMPFALNGDLRRAEFTDGVQMNYAGRVAKGDRAIIEREDSTISLSGEKGAELLDERGLYLNAKNFIFYHNDGRIYATGPGTLHIAGSAAENMRAAAGGISSEPKRTSDKKDNHLPGTSPLDYTLTFERDMAYNLIKHQIVFRQNVSISQETLTGRCDALEVMLGINPMRQLTGEEISGLTMQSAECVGDVFFRRLEPPNTYESLEEIIKEGPDSDRAGKTILLESDRAFFNVPKGVILFEKRHKQVRILEQVVEVVGHVGDETRKSRDMIICDEALLDRNTGHTVFRGHVVRSQPSAKGPLRFPD